jgi:hypothetical protein
MNALRLPVAVLVLSFCVFLCPSVAGPAARSVAVVRNTFVLTQAFCLPPQAPAPGTCREQSVPVGATLEIQLPGTPSTW